MVCFYDAFQLLLCSYSYPLGCGAGMLKSNIFSALSERIISGLYVVLSGSEWADMRLQVPVSSVAT